MKHAGKTGIKQENTGILLCYPAISSVFQCSYEFDRKENECQRY